MVKKKRWEKPVLSVLVRGRAEESVLQFCKVFNVPWNPPYDSSTGGGTPDPCHTYTCSPCNLESNS